MAKPTAGDIMTREVVTFSEHMSVRDALKIIYDKNFSGCPVVDEDGLLIGITSEKDLISVLSVGGTRNPAELDKPIPFTAEAIAITKNMPLEEVRKLFVKFEFKRFPVVDQDRKIEGIVSRKNIVRAMYEMSIGKL
jgi:CBS domain-containing protein